MDSHLVLLSRKMKIIGDQLQVIYYGEWNILFQKIVQKFQNHLKRDSLSKELDQEMV